VCVAYWAPNSQWFTKLQGLSTSTHTLAPGVGRPWTMLQPRPCDARTGGRSGRAQIPPPATGASPCAGGCSLRPSLARRACAPRHGLQHVQLRPLGRRRGGQGVAGPWTAAAASVALARPMAASGAGKVPRAARKGQLVVIFGAPSRCSPYATGRALPTPQARGYRSGAADASQIAHSLRSGRPSRLVTAPPAPARTDIGADRQWRAPR
jgi:hypothetical protein